MNSETITVSMTQELKQFCEEMGKINAVSAGTWIRQFLNTEMKNAGKGFAS